jgi:hypothetical protein
VKPACQQGKRNHGKSGDAYSIHRIPPTNDLDENHDRSFSRPNSDPLTTFVHRRSMNFTIAA